MATLMLLVLLIAATNEVHSKDCRFIKFKPYSRDRVLVNHIIRSMRLSSRDQCELRCYHEPNCVSYNYGPTESETSWCDLNNRTHLQVSSDDFVIRNGYVYREILNSCQSNPCPSNSTCQSGYGNQGYRCVCPGGYHGDKCQFDIKECIDGSHNCSTYASCVDVPGSFQCHCKSGFTGDGLNCEDINECLDGSHNCSQYASCVDVPGSFQCNCNSGFTGDGVDCQVSANDCSEAAQTTGIHQILNHGLQPFSVYCDQSTDGGGWTMIFKVVKGVLPYTIDDLWFNNDTLAENVDAALDTTSTYQGHYKSRVVLDWQTCNPKEARVVLYTSGTEVAYLKFNASGIDNANWFSQKNLVESPWINLQTTTNAWAFSIDGAGRTFEIHSPYAGCENDMGWMVITKPICPWENSRPVPSILYSKLSTRVNWNQFDDVGSADVMIVYIR